MLDFRPLVQTIGANRAEQRQNAMDVRNARREDQADARAAESHGWQRDTHQAQRRQRAIESMAGVAQSIMESPAEMQAQRYQQFRSAIPDFDADMTAAGFDPNNWQATLPAIVAKSRGYQDPLERQGKEADIAYKQAQTAKLGREASGDAAYDSLKDRANVEEGLRKEVYNTNKEYAVIRDSAAKIEAIAQQPSAASDMALVFSYMKILDPNSVVRETEYANAENARGVPDAVKNIWNKVLQGEFLTPNQRTDFLTQARTMARTQQGQYERSLNQYSGVAERLRVDPRNVILEDTPQPPPVPPEALSTLRSDPSPEAMREFDEIFGQGAAQRALGGR